MYLPTAIFSLQCRLFLLAKCFPSQGHAMLLYCANVSGSCSGHLVGVHDTKYWDYLYSDVVLGILINWFCAAFPSVHYLA